MTRNVGGGLPITVFDINYIQVDPMAFTKKHKRTKTTCVICHELKRPAFSAGSSWVMNVDGRTRADPIQANVDTNNGSAENGNNDDDDDCGGGGPSSSIDVSDTTHSASPVVSHASHSTRALSPPPSPPSAAASALLLPRLPSPEPRVPADTSV